MHGWTDYTPSNVDELFQRLYEIGFQDGGCLCRGQSFKGWKLRSSIDRGMESVESYADRLEQETDLQAEFAERTEQLWGTIESHFLDNWEGCDRVRRSILMQHYGAPTRLLDWTISIYVATFFCCVSERSEDGAIWWVNLREYQEASEPLKENLKKVINYEGDFDYNKHVYSVFPTGFVGLLGVNIPFMRIECQQAAFTIGDQLGQDHDEFIREIVPDSKRGRIIIPAVVKADALNALRQMNITAASLLYNGADSIGLRMAWERQRKLEAASPPAS